MNIDETKLATDFEISVQKAWAETSKSDPNVPPKAAFRAGFSHGIMFATLALAENLTKVVEKVEQSGK